MPHETDPTLQTIETTLGFLRDSIGNLTTETRHVRSEADARGRDFQTALAKVDKSVIETRGDLKSIDTKLNAHIDHDNGRFSILWRVILGSGVAIGGGAGVFKILTE